MYTSLSQLRKDVSTCQQSLDTHLLDKIVYSSQFSPTEEIRTAAQKAIHTLAEEHDVISSSMHDVYEAFGQEKLKGFTIPALNIRTLTYDIAELVFTIAQKHSIGPIIFEIAVSEQDYTDQPPAQYAAAVLGGALKAGYTGPVFLQGDHYQIHRNAYHTDRADEITRIELLIRESLAAGFKNIDIDGSTIVNLEPEDHDLQQKKNYEVTAHFTRFIRKVADEIVAIGGEIGHIGGTNSSVEDLHAFMKGYRQIVGDTEGISKIAIQTGTSHGGTPTTDGSVKPVDLAIDLHTEIGNAARSEYGLGGTVQHGASTLPEDAFSQFPEHNTLEIHLATGFQNTVYKHLPEDLTQEIYTYLKQEYKKAWKDEWNETQFLYKLRKKGFGPFKQVLWDMKPDAKQPVLNALEKQFTNIFSQLQIFGSSKKIQQYL